MEYWSSGILVKWNEEKAFGFIKRDSGGDVFCHVSQFVGGIGSIKEGDKVTFVAGVDSRSGKERATQVSLAPVRGRCRYGGACYRKSPDHLAEFAHPGDPDWDQAVDLSKVAASSSSIVVSKGKGAGSLASSLSSTVATSKGKGEARLNVSTNGDVVNTTSKTDSAKGASKSDVINTTSKIASLKGTANSDSSKGPQNSKTKGDDSTKDVTNKISVGKDSTPKRTPCRFGKDCYRDGPEHRREYSHPGDDDWAKACKICLDTSVTENDSNVATKTSSGNMVKSYATDSARHTSKHITPVMPEAKVQGVLLGMPKPKAKAQGHRHCCQYGKDCKTQGREHRKVFAHPGDADWVDPAGTSSIVLPALRISPAWLNFLTPIQVEDLSADLEHMSGMFHLDTAGIVEEDASRCIELTATSAVLLDEAKHELCKDDGLLAFYESQADSSKPPVNNVSPLPPDANSSISSSAPETAKMTQAAFEKSQPPPETNSNEIDMRIDPDDCQAYTFERFFQKYQDSYTPKEMKQYWQTMLPANSTGGQKAVQKW